MKFHDLSVYLEKLESTASRNSMVEILSDLFKKADKDEIDKLMYLLQGRVVPIYVSLEFGMAEKMVIRAIALAFNHEVKAVTQLFKKEGDVGVIAEQLASSHKSNKTNPSINDVYDVLKKIAKTSGPGSVDVKIKYLSDLLSSLDPRSSRFVSRIPIGAMRLGFSDMTVLDSLSWMVSGDKSKRKEIEAAFNARPDLGFIGKTIKEKGVKGLVDVKPAVFNPILMARAERLSSGDEIIAKIGTCAVEPKFDGFRLQAHFLKDKKEVKLFTRNLEEVTFMYPDVVEGIVNQIDAQEVIFEGEAIAFHPQTGEYLPFQETSQRKRKYDIAQKAKEIPLKLIVFDLLYLNGKSMIDQPYKERRKRLAQIIKNEGAIILSDEHTVDKGKEIEVLFDDALSQGLEGILAKRLDGVYQAGARGWNWIKLKRSYSARLDDTIDALVMGYYVGQGKRASFGIGAFLIGVYDNKSDQFVTIAKIGTGLTDEEWRGLAVRGTKLKAREKPPLYVVDAFLTPDIWVEPHIVVEIRADEITRSSIHTAGRVMKTSKSGSAFDVDIPGYALRFPRLEKFRDDKKIEDTTSLKEIESMYAIQGVNKEKK